MKPLEKLSRDLEHYATPDWAAAEILHHEILTRVVVDPCTGTGVLAEAARRAGYLARAFDIHDWGYPKTNIVDFIDRRPDAPYNLPRLTRAVTGNTVFMNPPFSKAVEFVERAIELKARKILCFQRFAWWESKERQEFWRRYIPNRIYICGDRATCWRHDIPVNARGKRINEAGKELSDSPIAHAWFVWEAGQPPGTLLSHIYRSKA